MPSSLGKERFPSSSVGLWLTFISREDAHQFRTSYPEIANSCGKVSATPFQERRQGLPFGSWGNPSLACGGRSTL